LWYLVADRYSPYTTQARVQGNVVGVAPKVSGLITHIAVKNNQTIQAGDLLFEIDTEQYDIALQKAQSDLAKAQNQVNAGNASVETARANLLSAIANQEKAQQDFSRLTRLHQEDPGTISVRRLEISKATLEQAKAGVISAKATITQAIEQKGGNDDTNNAILISAQSAVAQAKLNLENTKVKASSDGLITDLSADIGQFVNPGNPVMTLIAINDVWINAEYTENNLGHIQIGDMVEILFDAIPGQVFSGNIRSIGLGVNTGSAHQPGTLPTIQNNRDWLRQAQRFPVMVSFNPNQNGNLLKQLRIGGQVSVITYPKDHGFMQWLGEFYIRLMSWLSYAY